MAVPGVIKRCYTFVGGGSSKFWTIESAGKFVFVTFGKIGSRGATQAKSFKTQTEAGRFVVDKITEKTSKGYTQVASSDYPGASDEILLSAVGSGSGSSGSAPAATPAAPSAGSEDCGPNSRGVRNLDL